MKTARIAFALLIPFFAAIDLIASGPVGIYAVIEKVVFEPNEKSPERVQVWGAFQFVENGIARPGALSTPRYGYLYFKLPDGRQQSAVRAEWADLKMVAGTGQAIGFGSWGLVGGFSGVDSAGTAPFPYFIANSADRNVQTDVRIRRAAEPPANLGIYSTSMGIVKLPQSSHATIIKGLNEALKNR